MGGEDLRNSIGIERYGVQWKSSGLEILEVDFSSMSIVVRDGYGFAILTMVTVVVQSS